MKYMLLIYVDENALSQDDFERCYAESARYARELDDRGQYIAAAPLQPTSTAASVRIRNDRPIVTDGPFAETREQFAGYFLIDVKDGREAIEVAARLPGAKLGVVEVRPVIDVPGLPETSDGAPGDRRMAGSPNEAIG